VLRRLDAAYKRFFEGVRAGEHTGLPKFKRRGEEPGLRYPDPKQFSFDAPNGRIKLPKLGWLRLRYSQTVEGTLRNVSVTREGARWFVSLKVEQRDAAEVQDVAPTLGIDLGLTKFIACSDGSVVEPLRSLAKQQGRLRHAQRAVSRKKKGSANRRKAAARLGALHRRIARQRSDWLHKLTVDLADRHAVVVLENLRITNMSASARGTVDVPGKNVATKAALNRSILDAAWGKFRCQLQYKLEWRGGRIILVDPAYTSRTCRLCGHECAENRKSQSLFLCVACRHAENADIHAAKNILAAGHAVWARQRARREMSPAACGGSIRRDAVARPRHAAPVKQEPAEANAPVRAQLAPAPTQ
jgi:putative transposase